MARTRKGSLRAILAAMLEWCLHRTLARETAMLTRAIVLLVAAAGVGFAEPAAAQCLPFDAGAACGRAEKPRFIVDFGAKEFKAAQPRQLPTPSPPPRDASSHVRLSHRPQTIDCAAVRRADGSSDPGLVTRAPATVGHTLRVLTVPNFSDDK